MDLMILNVSVSIRIKSMIAKPKSAQKLIVKIVVALKVHGHALVEPNLVNMKQ